MGDIALRLAKVRAIIAALWSDKTRLEHELRMARMDNTRLRRAVVGLQRQQTRRGSASGH
jgi:hypothetical protein